MTDQTPIRKGLSQTPLARFGNLSGVLSQESDEEESNERNHDKGMKMFNVTFSYNRHVVFYRCFIVVNYRCFTITSRRRDIIMIIRSCLYCDY